MEIGNCRAVSAIVGEHNPESTDQGSQFVLRLPCTRIGQFVPITVTEHGNACGKACGVKDVRPCGFNTTGILPKEEKYVNISGGVRWEDRR